MHGLAEKSRVKDPSTSGSPHILLDILRVISIVDDQVVESWSNPVLARSSSIAA